MPVTPDALRSALAAHPRVDDACAAVGISRQGAHLRPDLRAVLAARAAARPRRNASRKLGQHCIALPRATVARLDRLAAQRSAVVGRKFGSRTAIARALIEAALLGELPKPIAEGGTSVVLDLGPAWEALAARLGTSDPQAIAGVVRAILGSQKIVGRRT